MASSVRSARRGVPRPSVVLTWLARSLILFVAAIVAALMTRQRTPMVVAACLSGVLLWLGVSRGFLKFAVHHYPRNTAGNGIVPLPRNS